jgi:hypothetical protein
MKELKIYQALKDRIPPLTEWEYDNLEESIIEEGCRDAIILATGPEGSEWNGAICDGHNRYEICQKHNIEFNTTEKYFETQTDAEMWIIINQLGRRNLNKFQRGELVLEAEELFEQKGKGFMSDGGKGGKGSQNSENLLRPTGSFDRYKEMGKAAGLSSDTMAKIKTLKVNADPTTLEELRSGEKSINKGYVEVRATLTTKKKEEAVDSKDWTEEELELKVQFENGETVICSSTIHHPKLVAWAKKEGKYISIPAEYSEQMAPLGNPFVPGVDCGRARAVDLYEDFVRNKKGIHADIGKLRGKILGSEHYPDFCHVTVLKREADNACQKCGFFRKQCSCEQ